MSDNLRTDDLTIPQGATFARQYPVTGISLVGATAAAQVRDVNGVLLYTFNPAVNSTAGTVTLQVAASDTWGLAFTKGVFNLLVTDVSGTVTEVVRGNVCVAPGVTR